MCIRVCVFLPGKSGVSDISFTLVFIQSSPVFLAPSLRITFSELIPQSQPLHS